MTELTARSVALDLDKKGYVVVPAFITWKDGKKHVESPTGWRQVKSPSQDRVFRTFSAPSASGGTLVPFIVTGPSGVVVADLDVKHEDGVMNWHQAVEGQMVPQACILPTTSGGEHWFYRADPDREVRNSQGDGRQVVPGVDMRGVGGGVFVHPCAWKYALTLPAARGLEPVPEFVHAFEASRHVERPAAVVTAEGFVDGREFTPDQARRYVTAQGLSRLEATPHGGINAALNNAAMVIGHFVPGLYTQDEAVEMLQQALASAKTAAGLAVADNMYKDVSTITSGLAAGMREPYRIVDEPVPFIVPGADITPDEAVELSYDEFKATIKASQRMDIGENVKVHSRYEKACTSSWGTSVGQAKWIAAQLGIAYAPGLGWLRWDGKRWASVEAEFPRRAAGEFVAARLASFSQRLSELPETDEGDMERDFISVMSRILKRTLDGMRRLQDDMQAVAAVPAEQFDADALLVNTPDGVLDLRTLAVEPHAKKFLMTKISAGSYRPGFAHADWDGVLSAFASDDVRDYMQRRAGQALTGRAPNSADVVFMRGNGSNGKSLFLTNGLLGAFGEYGAVCSSALLSPMGVGDATSSHLLRLKGLRLAVVEELPSSMKHLDENALKRAAGTDRITARGLYQSAVEWTPTHSLFLSLNVFPATSSTEDGVWRRIALVDMPFRFVSGEPSRPNQRRGDSMLGFRIAENGSGQLDAVFTWVVEGARLWLKDPESICVQARPASSIEAVRELREDSDVEGEVVEQSLELDPSACVLVRDLFEFAVSRGLAVVRPGERLADAQKAFTRRLKSGQWYTENFVAAAGTSGRGGGVEVKKARPARLGLSRPAGAFSQVGSAPTAVLFGVRFVDEVAVGVSSW